MANTFLGLSKQGHVGFRIPRSTCTSTSSFPVVSLQLLRNNARSFFSWQPSISNNAAARYRHHQGRSCLSSCPRIVLLRPLHSSPPWLPSSTASAAKRNEREGDASVGWFSSILDRKTSCRSLAAMSQSSIQNAGNTKGDREIAGRRQPQKQPQKELLTVSDILGQYTQRREKLKPYQVASTWHGVGKAVQNSRRWEERQNFWIENKASLRMLIDQTVCSVDQLNGRSTATVTHSLVKLLHLTNSKSLDGELLSLWDAILRKTILHIQSDGFNAFEVSNLIWAYAKAAAGGIKKVDGHLLDALAHKVELCIDDFEPQGLANVAWGFATLGHKAPSLFDSIALAAPIRIHEFKPQDLSNTAWAFAKLNHKASLLFDAIARSAPVHIGDFKPQELSNTAWAFATLNHEAQLLFDVIAQAAPVRINVFTTQALSNTAWAFATLKHEAPALLDVIANAAQVQIHKFNPQELSNMAWAFATLNQEAELLFDAIARASQVGINDFNAQELSNTAWAFATLNHEAPPLLLDAIARAAQVRIDEFNPQNLSNTAWAFATLGHEAPSLLEAIARASQVKIDEFNPQDLSNTAWSFATLNHKVQLLFDAIARAAPVRIGGFKPQELSNTAWAYATLNHEAPSLLEAIARAAQVQIYKFNPQDLSNTTWSFATLNHEAPLLFDAIARAAPVRIGDFKPQELSNTAWAYATLNHEAPSLFDAIARAAAARINDFNPQSLANIAWSFAVFTMESNSFTNRDTPFAQTLLSSDPLSFSVEDIHQLHQFQLWCKEQNGASWYPNELSRRCQEVIVSSKVEPSRLQNDIVTALRTVQDVSQVEVEVSTMSGYSVDAMVMFRGERIGVEVDGPPHFLGQSQSPNGSTILKRRQLHALEDWKLVAIPYWEWNGIDKGSNNERREKKQRYLQKLLDEALVVSK